MTPEERAKRLVESINKRRDSSHHWGDEWTSSTHQSEQEATLEINEAIAEERERCARVAERMMVVGRMWTEDQAFAAKVLRDVADVIRKDPS